MTEQKSSDFALYLKAAEALEKRGFRSCTSVQALALPLTLASRDVVERARTSTGKTMAFPTSTFHYLLSHPVVTDCKVSQPRALIMASTHKLTMQIRVDAGPLVGTTNPKLGLAYGGDGYDKQLKMLKGDVDILIGITGRLVDCAKQNHTDLGAIRVAVLDGTDCMYGLGFTKDIRWLFRRTSPANQRLNVPFSATLSYRVCELAFEQMNNAEYTRMEPEQEASHRTKGELFYPFNEEEMCLSQTLIGEEWPDKAITFINTKHHCEEIWDRLVVDGHRVDLLTGDVAQKERLRILDELTHGGLDTLAATDVATRSLHIPTMTHVFSCDLPDDCEDYVHRISRTGCADVGGHSISLAREEHALNSPAIETYTGHSVPVSKYNPDVLVTDLSKSLCPTRLCIGSGPHRAGAPCDRHCSD